MNHVVLARKYRPRTFEEMIGQEHVLRALTNAFQQNRLHHAYLFTGTRGVGKTTLARILARCLNCETGITSTPCNQCTTCKEIEAGRFVDLLEIDAASRTKVEDTREILDNVQYAPSRGRFKVYLIDEVHMLSGHSFNALLKTLEEPPPHVKFLLATTDPQKLPVTVLSRCLQFNLKNLLPEQIKLHLEKILVQEKIPCEPSALTPIAHAAQGSVRDSLSLLDQAIAYGGGEIKIDEIKAMLGVIENTHITQLVEALAQQDAHKILTIIQQLAERATDFGSALEALLTELHRLTIAQIAPNALDASEEDNQKTLQLAQQLSAQDIQLFYQIGLIGRRDLPLAPSPRSGFEMVLLRMLAFRLAETDTPTNKVISSTPREITTPINVNKTIATPTAEKTPITEWSKLVGQLNLNGFALALANHCMVQSFENNQLHLVLDPSQIALRNPKQETRLSEALNQYYGKPIALKISNGQTPLATPARLKTEHQTTQLNEATSAIEKDAKIQSIIKAFNATIQPGSIQVKEDKVVESNT